MTKQSDGVIELDKGSRINASTGWISAMAIGLGSSLAVWCVWFVTHLPQAGIAEPVALTAIVVAWMASAVWWARALPGRVVATSALGGLIAAGAGLLALGTRLREMPTGGAGSPGALLPESWLIVLGFLALGGVIGAIGGAIGRAAPRAQPRAKTTDWLATFAVVTACAMVPLLIVGGLVTSTNSGMAVPDWPNTFGTNMFFYPLGPRAAPSVFLEHSHRLFGTLVGLMSLALVFAALRIESRGWVKGWAIAVFLLVCVQGVLGGLRVMQGSVEGAKDARWLAAAHGVFGQLVFAAGVALAVYLSSAYREGVATPAPNARRVRAMATGAFHAMILQLIFGAMYRHMRSPHALWSHVGFSIIVMVIGLLAGMVASSGESAPARISTAVRRAGIGVIAILCLQFILGWLTFLLGGKGLTPDSFAQALVRTVHHANNVASLAAVTALAVLARRAAAPAPS